MTSSNIVRAALEQLLAVIDSHGTESVGCDRDGETHCDCLLHAAQNAKAALSDEEVSK